MFYFYEWHGTPFEIGRQYGAALRAEIIDEYNRSLPMWCERTGLSEARFLERHMAQYGPVFRDLVPRAMEEIEGMARGAELSGAHAFFAATRDGTKIPVARVEEETAAAEAEACTSFYCGKETTAQGNVLLGQTKDTGALLSRYRTMVFHYDDGSSTVNLNYPGWMANMGLSSHGLANTGNSLFGQAAANETVPFALIKRLAMEKRSTDEVLRALSGLSFENGCFLIADRTGSAVCQEWVGGDCAVFDISKRAFGHANRILAPELQSLENAPDGSNCDLESSFDRQRNVQRLLDEKVGALDMAAVKEIAADHGDAPYCICRHEEAGQGKTSAAIVADVSGGRVQICIGNPCQAQWHEIALP